MCRYNIFQHACGHTNPEHFPTDHMSYHRDYCDLAGNQVEVILNCEAAYQSQRTVENAQRVAFAIHEARAGPNYRPARTSTQPPPHLPENEGPSRSRSPGLHLRRPLRDRSLRENPPQGGQRLPSSQINPQYLSSGREVWDLPPPPPYQVPLSPMINSGHPLSPQPMQASPYGNDIRRLPTPSILRQLGPLPPNRASASPPGVPPYEPSPGGPRMATPRILRKRSWSPEEDGKLINMRLHGHTLQVIAQQLPGRTREDCTSRWEELRRQGGIHPYYWPAGSGAQSAGSASQHAAREPSVTVGPSDAGTVPRPLSRARSHSRTRALAEDVRNYHQAGPRGESRGRSRERSPGFQASTLRRMGSHSRSRSSSQSGYPPPLTAAQGMIRSRSHSVAAASRSPARRPQPVRRVTASPFMQQAGMSPSQQLVSRPGIPIAGQPRQQRSRSSSLAGVQLSPRPLSASEFHPAIQSRPSSRTGRPSVGRTGSTNPARG
ncbi:hypothetical protein BAUCODRAFT_132024 [Baudoinia panamericana UAMH 10762]|uniref:Uncharacterized protein n=1 Tax=Baudoinia panamericana (strain UAMH 10762) TaxID=717646 RepID=M2N7X0_BAUPA|nr:uncharacterized protein BAUCODRAFT_132024 [Baudoinia panamericana UAMH 10762]EMC95179.1 hypothetical protein BAUCODRAFT_132024 [Baudoinia panamericana UAMH 10762]